jgi:predicted GNAT family acetyltransferase
MAEITVRDNPGESRFDVFVDGAFAGFSVYRLTEDQVIFPHVEVDPRFRGRGVASTLVRHALDTVREEGTRTVVPVCPFVKTFIRRYPEYQPLVDGPVQTPAEG